MRIELGLSREVQHVSRSVYRKLNTVDATSWNAVTTWLDNPNFIGCNHFMLHSMDLVSGEILLVERPSSLIARSDVWRGRSVACIARELPHRACTVWHDGLKFYSSYFYKILLTTSACTAACIRASSIKLCRKTKGYSFARPCPPRRKWGTRHHWRDWAWLIQGFAEYSD